MDAIILVGGQGTRLRSVVPDLPKPLAVVNGRPFLDLLMTQLAGFSRIRKVILAVGYKADLIRERYSGSREFGFPIEFSVEDVPMGTGGAILMALQRSDSRDVLVMNGDSFADFRLDALAADHAAKSASITMVVVRMEDTARFGRVELDANCRVVGFVEKGVSQGGGLINAGCYLLASRQFRSEVPRALSFERDLLPGCLQATYAHVAEGRFIDIGVPESYAAAGDYLK